MSDVLAGTPSSYAEPGGSASKMPAVKNRSCPFCRALFTSSSLGRHLDLYIKEKNPKPPDGVHDVEEIRRLRGGVTRRQPRTSSVKGEDSTHSSSKPTSLRDQRSPSVSVFLAGPGHVNGTSATKTPLHRAKWEAAGVVNGLSPRSDGGEPPSHLAKRRSNMRNVSLKEDLARKQEVMEERDRGQAAELALKEVLESVKAANLRAHPRTLFNFNWFAQSFPALCLRCLPAPVEFVSTPRFPGRPSWPMEPPGADQVLHLEFWLMARLDSWKRRRRPLGGDSYNKINGTNGHAIQPQTVQEADEEKNIMKHLLSAYQVWKSLSDEQKQETWRSECQRAFVREQEAHNSTNARLAMVEQQLHHLQAQLDQGKNSKQAIGTSQFLTSTIPLSHETLDELNNDTDASNLDYESAILKWKTRIRNERNTQQPLPRAPPISKPRWPQTLIPKPRTNSIAPPPMQQAHRGDQHLQQHDDGPIDLEHETPPDEVDNDEDLIDAPGDDDDEEGSVHCHSSMAPDRVAEDGQALDPDLVNHMDNVMKATSSGTGTGTDTGTREATRADFSSGGGTSLLPPGLQVEYMKM